MTDTIPRKEKLNGACGEYNHPFLVNLIFHLCCPSLLVHDIEICQIKKHCLRPVAPYACMCLCSARETGQRRGASLCEASTARDRAPRGMAAVPAVWCLAKRDEIYCGRSRQRSCSARTNRSALLYKLHVLFKYKKWKHQRSLLYKLHVLFKNSTLWCGVK